MSAIYGISIGVAIGILVLLATPFLACAFSAFMEWYEAKLYKWFRFRM